MGAGGNEPDTRYSPLLVRCELCRCPGVRVGCRVGAERELCHTWAACAAELSLIERLGLRFGEVLILIEMSLRKHDTT